MKGKSQTVTLKDLPSISSVPDVDNLQYGSFIIAIPITFLK
tara:strand:+ start:532 stop:654 length:123 start_codon:yes stop_codon:yes gene_type:complete